MSVQDFVSAYFAKLEAESQRDGMLAHTVDAVIVGRVLNQTQQRVRANARGLYETRGRTRCQWDLTDEDDRIALLALAKAAGKTVKVMPTERKAHAVAGARAMIGSMAQYAKLPETKPVETKPVETKSASK